jgi:hypothetical protein
MSKYFKSSLSLKPRIQFDPRNKKHMLDFARFVKYNNWKDGCAYYLEDPFTDIPSMIRTKIAESTLSTYLKKV